MQQRKVGTRAVEETEGRAEHRDGEIAREIASPFLTWQSVAFLSGGLERRGDKPRRREISGDAPTPPRRVAVYLSITVEKRRKDGIIKELEYVGHYGNYPRFSGPAGAVTDLYS